MRERLLLRSDGFSPGVGTLYTRHPCESSKSPSASNGGLSFMKRFGILAAAAMAFGLSIAPAVAGPINQPVPSNAYITLNGFDWAWASPCPALGGRGTGETCGNGLQAVDLTYQSTLGWRFPTAAELLLAPVAQDFLFAGGNVPLGVVAPGTKFGPVDPLSGSRFRFRDQLAGSVAPAGACAATYFSISYTNCDFNDGLNGGRGLPWALPNSLGFLEQLVLRPNDEIIIIQSVPEPSTLALIGLALLSLFGMGLMRQRGAA